MNPGQVSFLLFVCVLCAAWLGMWLTKALPHHHLSADTKDSVRLGVGLVSSIAALVLGLLVASTNGAYESEKSEVTRVAAKAAYLDRVLESYGPEAEKARGLLREMLNRAIAYTWPADDARPPMLDPSVAGGEELHAAIHDLVPQTERQRSLKLEAAQLVSGLGEARWLLFEQAEPSISIVVVLAVLFWLVLVFVSLGMFAPRNHTVTASLVVAALSVAGSMYLILELAQPFSGVIKISSAPLRDALERMGK